MSKWALVAAVVTGQPVDVVHSQGTLRGYVASVEREDGSGHCFNVNVYPGDGKPFVTVFVRTLD